MTSDDDEELDLDDDGTLHGTHAEEATIFTLPPSPVTSYEPATKTFGASGEERSSYERRETGTPAKKAAPLKMRQQRKLACRRRQRQNSGQEGSSRSKEGGCEESVKVATKKVAAKKVLAKKAEKGRQIEICREEVSARAAVRPLLKKRLVKKSTKKSTKRGITLATKKAAKKAVVKKAVKKAVVKKAVKRAIVKKAIKRAIVKKAIKRAIVKKAIAKKIAKS